MEQKELNKILREHKDWLDGNGGKQADLSSADLRGADLHFDDLRKADLHNADLRGADLHFDDLRGADLHGADLRGADLHGADLRGADLRGANLTYSSINQATTFSKKESIRKGMILDKPMTGYKKTYEDVIIKVEIPAGAIVYSINNYKCRTNMAKIVDMGGKKLLHTIYDNDFTYKKGQKIVIKDFDLNPAVECSTGFHFFRKRKDAENF